MEKRLTKEEFLKDLWHPANEIPKEFNHYGFAALYILQSLLSRLEIIGAEKARI